MDRLHARGNDIGAARCPPRRRSSRSGRPFARTVRCFRAAWLAFLLAACQQAAPPPAAPAPKVAPPPVAQQPAPAAVAKAPPAALPSLDFPAGPLYYCEAAGNRTAIDYEPRVDKLCRRHPEMGPCQYERDQCRASGGRVFTARGEEVTRAVEAEYDRVVRRVRFQADGGKK